MSRRFADRAFRPPGRRVLAGALLVAAAAAGVACTDEIPLDLPETRSVRLYPDSTDLRIGRTLQLEALPMDDRGSLLPGRSITWSSDAPGVASVDEDGLVHGENTGTATISAQVDGVVGTTRVRVQPDPAIGLSATTLLFQKAADEADPAPESVAVSNVGGFELEGLEVAAIAYDGGAADWLQATLDTSVAPATLEFSVDGSPTAAGTYQATVTLTALDAANSPAAIAVTLTIAPGEPTTAEGNGDAQSAPAGSAVPTPPSIRLADAFDNPVPGVAVTFAVVGGGGSAIGADQVTGADGRASVGAWTLGTAIGENTLTATPDAPGVAPVTFTATAVPGSASRLVLVGGDGQTATVATAVTVAPTVRVTDAFDNPIPGVPVGFAVTVGGGSATATAATSAADGTASVGSWTLGEAAGENVLIATVNGVPDTARFVATGAADVASSAVAAAGNDQTATVATPVAVPPAVRVTDQYGNPVAGLAVDFSITAGSGSLTGASTTTGTDGLAALGSWTLGTTAGTNALQATVAGLAGSPVPFTATGLADSPTQVAVFAGDNQDALPGDTVATRPAVRVRDQYNNPVGGVDVFWEVTSGGGSISLAATQTDADGVARPGVWTLGVLVGPNTLLATVDRSGVTGNPITFTATATLDPTTAVPDPDSSSVSAMPTTIVASSGGSTSIVTVVVRDENGNRIPEASVTIAVEPSAGVTVTQPDAPTDAMGEASASFYSTQQGRKTVTATVNGSVVVTETAVVDVGPAAPSTSVSSVVASTDLITANDDGSSTATVTVTVRDEFGNPVPGVEVTPASSGTANVFTPASAVSDGAGMAGFGFRSTAAQTKTISAVLTGTGTIGQTVTITVEPAAASTAESLVSATSPIVASSGSSVSTVTVTVRDAFGNVRSGHDITIGVDGAANTVTQPAAPTNASGEATGSFHSTVAEPKTVSAAIDGVGTIAQTAAVTVDPGPASLAGSTVDATGPITADDEGATSDTRSTVTVTVRDAFGNPRAGHGVTLSVSGTGNTVTQPAATDGNGMTTGSFYSTVALAKTVSAVTDGVGTIAQQPVVQVEAAAPSTVAVTNQNNSARVGTALATLPTFTVRDEFGNPVPNTAVTFGATGGGAFSAPATTDASGQLVPTSWSMGGTATDDAQGRMPNTLTLTAGAAQGVATGYGIYTWSGDLNGLVGSASTCNDCHSFTRSPTNAIVGVNGTFGTACDSFTRVVASNASASILYTKLTSTPSCGDQMFFNHSSTTARREFTADELKRVRAWINNGALDN